MISRERASAIMDQVFEECRKLRAAGQAEYAHRDENALANFERVGERLGLSREQVLLVYLEKHMDGIHAWVKGHRSQREDVRGRIGDALVYLCLLRAMVEDDTSCLDAGALCSLCRGKRVVIEFSPSGDRNKPDVEVECPECRGTGKAGKDQRRIEA